MAGDLHLPAKESRRTNQKLKTGSLVNVTGMTGPRKRRYWKEFWSGFSGFATGLAHLALSGLSAADLFIKCFAVFRSSRF